jgi:hypothetical protein
MSNLLRKLTSRGLSFSHLAKVDPHAADDTPPADDDNKDGKKGKKAADDGPDDQNRDDGDSSGKKGKKAADDSVDPDDDSEEGKKGKKAAADDPDPDAEDDDDEEEMRGNSASAQARRRERARCASIMGSQHAGRNPVLAANLAFTSTMSRKEAIAILKDTPTSAAAAPPVRKNPALGTGGDATVTSGQAIASSWDRAMQKARSGSGKKR